MKTRSIDPGSGYAGIADWRDQELILAWFDTTEEWSTEYSFDLLVIEFPQIYPKTSLSQCQALLELAYHVGQLAQSARSLSIPVHFYRPYQWKGQTPKQIHNGRVLSALTDDERSRMRMPRNKKHRSDVIDATGIGLFHLGRIDKAGAVL